MLSPFPYSTRLRRLPGVLMAAFALLLLLYFVTRGAALGGGNAWLDLVEIAAADGASGDRFGHAAALDGSYLLVGAPDQDAACPTDPECNAGAAYLYEEDAGGTGQWGQQRRLTASGGAAGDLFGWSVAISGDIAAVGAPKQDGVCPSDPNCDSGAVYLFERSAGGTGNWGQVAMITAPSTALGDEFGSDVALDGTRLIVGAPYADDATSNGGAAYLFERDQGGAGAWGHVATLTAADSAPNDWFGNAVDVSADRVIVGAHRRGDAGIASGAAYVFERNTGGSGAWGQQAKLLPDDGEVNDWFGVAVAIDGEVAVAGSYWDDDLGSTSGSAYLFERATGGAGNWGQSAKLLASNGGASDYFGYAVDAAGTTVVVGGYRNDAGCGSISCDYGAVYVFERGAGGLWTESSLILAGDGAAGDSLGHAVALDGDLIAAGAPQRDGVAVNSGAAHLFLASSLHDLTVSTTVVPGTAAPGEPVQITIDVDNQGLSTATGIVLTDILPSLIEVTDVSASGLSITDSEVSPGYVWMVGDIAPQQGGTVTISGRVRPTASSDSVSTLTASLSATNEDADSSNNSASATLHVVVPRILFQPSSHFASEADGDVTVTVVLDSANPHAPVEVAYSTGGGSATAGADYLSASGTLTIPAGTNQATFVVSVVDDEEDENDEDLNLLLSAPVGAALGWPSSGTLTIADDDGAGVHVWPTSLQVGEPGSSQSFTIWLNSAPSDPVTFQMSSLVPAECAVTPDSVTLNQSNWSAGVEVTVSAVDDDYADGSQACTVHTGFGDSGDINYFGVKPDNVEVEVADDDTVGVVISPLHVNVAEGGATDSYTIRLTSRPYAWVQIFIDGGSQTSPGASVVQFEPDNWNVPQSVTVFARNDGWNEPSPHNGTITHQVASVDPAYQNLPAADVTASILDSTQVILRLPTILYYYRGTLSDPAP